MISPNILQSFPLDSYIVEIQLGPHSFTWSRLSRDHLLVERGEQTFSIKGQLLNILGFAGQKASYHYSILLLEHENSHRQYAKMNGCANKTL